MKVGIFYNEKYLSDNLSYIDKIIGNLNANGVSCKVTNAVSEFSDLDILIVLGGDGTILSVAAECAKRKIKIIGINYGKLGFLAEFERNKIDKAIQLILSGSYKTEKRSVLEIEKDGKIYYALNDVVVQRSTQGSFYSNTINLTAEINGSTVDNFRSDGLIVSTPTGSTAYSLAAGGSVLTPDIQAFILTPICAHSLHSRPIVFSDKSTLVIKRGQTASELNLSIDGKVVETCSDFDKITVKKANIYVEFIVSGETDFFNKLQIKFDKWSK